MSDFHQRGLISTLPRLTSRSLDDLERRLCVLAEANRVALILPCTLDDLRGPALRQIVTELRSARYFSTIVVSVNQASMSDLCAIELLLGEDPRMVVLWNDQPDWKRKFPGKGGKGFNLWTALGYLHARGDCTCVVTHDTDILNYTRELPALLALPLLDPALGYRFVKGYYPRLSESMGGQLFGRVTRLVVGPLLRALIRVEGHSPLVDFLDGFRYPLAGEFGGRLDDLIQFALPENWSLEMDLLCSVHRALTPDTVAQVDLGSNYEHKHQQIGNTNSGITRLSTEIISCLLRQMSREGLRVTPDFLGALRAAYDKSARNTVRRYRHVALFNQFEYNEEKELQLVEEISRFLTLASTDSAVSLIPWSELQRVQCYSIKDFPLVTLPGLKT